jgi:hypothetical protein
VQFAIRFGAGPLQPGDVLAQIFTRRYRMWRMTGASGAADRPNFR